MYFIGKLVGLVLNPFSVFALLVLISGLLRIIIGSRIATRASTIIFIFSVVWIWICGTPALTWIVGRSLEREFLVDGRVPSCNGFSNADAILLLGGSMGVSTNISDVAEMWGSADRVWRAAQLYKAGKAPKVVVTGGGVKSSTKGLLLDLGVDEQAIVFDEAPRNTKEEALSASAAGYSSAIVVTSAWHMKRAMLTFKKYAPNVVVTPAPADFENTLTTSNGLSVRDFLPTSSALGANTIALHEWLGYLACKFLK